MAYFKVLFHYLLGRTEKNHKILGQDNQHVDQQKNLVSTRYESFMPTNQP